MEDFLRPAIRYVRDTSPYFQQLYSSLPHDATLGDLPIVDHTSYWEASNKDRRLVMTGPQIDGIVMKTGGTTSRPKTTAYSQIELQRTASLLADGLMAGGVRSGDRIANMFYVGDLYASFLLHVLSIMALPIPVVHLPIGGLTAVTDAVGLIKQCDATVLLTTATSLVKLAVHTISLGEQNHSVRVALFGGEPLFPEQKAIIKQAFPRATIKSCIYGTIDAGVLAKPGQGDDTQVHQAFTETTVLEILRNDGSGVAIEEPEVPGLLVATNLMRQLCPVIRYPTGDRAAWVDKDKGIFRLLGRAGQAVRLGPVSIDMVDVRAVVTRSMPNATVQGVQAVVSRSGGVDQLECVVAASVVNSAAVSVAKTIELELNRQCPMFKQHVDLNLVAPLVVRFAKFEDLRLTTGSHKLMDVVEKRF